MVYVGRNFGYSPKGTQLFPLIIKCSCNPYAGVFFSLAMQLPAETSKRPKWWRYWGSTQKYRWSIGATKRCWDYTFSNLRNEMTLYTCIYIYKYIEICSISGYSKNRVLHTCPALQARKGLNVLASNPWKIQSIFSTLWGAASYWASWRCCHSGDLASRTMSPSRRNFGAVGLRKPKLPRWRLSMRQPAALAFKCPKVFIIFRMFFAKFWESSQSLED